jgi:uncharacterized protein YbjT (DUF2867 family)
MAQTLLTGATGVLGQRLQAELVSDGHDLRAASREPPDSGEVDWVGLDLVDGTGVRSAVDDVETVVHAASNATGDSEAVDVRGTERLLDAAEDAGVSNFLYISIVGIERIPYSYYQHKLEAEQAIANSTVPSTIIRSTQFHPFLASILFSVRRLPIWPLPTQWRLQPIDVGDAAAQIVRHATPDAAGRVPDIGGPSVLTVRNLAEGYRERLGKRSPIVRIPIPGELASAFRSGAATCPERAVGSVSWTGWLDAQDGVPGSGHY